MKIGDIKWEETKKGIYDGWTFESYYYRISSFCHQSIIYYNIFFRIGSKILPLDYRKYHNDDALIESLDHAKKICQDHFRDSVKSYLLKGNVLANVYFNEKHDCIVKYFNKNNKKSSQTLVYPEKGYVYFSVLNDNLHEDKFTIAIMQYGQIYHKINGFEDGVYKNINEEEVDQIIENSLGKG